MGTTHENDRLPADLRAAHDAVMASAPIPYRGYSLKPVSHRHRPHFDCGVFTYWGWVVVDAMGANAGPGATWGKTIEQAKHIVDCLYEAGPHPGITWFMPMTVEERDTVKALGKAQEDWNRRFWGLMRESA